MDERNNLGIEVRIITTDRRHTQDVVCRIQSRMIDGTYYSELHQEWKSARPTPGNLEDLLTVLSATVSDAIVARYGVQGVFVR